MRHKIGFMQGRLSPMVNGKIQAFPKDHWQEEFSKAHALEIGKMEWTLDQEDLYQNPFMNPKGQSEIQSLQKKYSVAIPSVTGDCFMQAPFFKFQDKASGYKQDRILDFENVIKSCGKLGVEFIVFPLVDNSSITSENDEICLFEVMNSQLQLLKDNHVKIVFESDFPPQKLKKFIAKFPKSFFGINYDIGNSASLGFDPQEEINAYGDRILNVHVKDRIRGGSTVPLGQGNAQFDVVFSELAKIPYSGNYILQTARAPNNEHEKFVQDFTLFVIGKIEKWT